MNIYTHIHVYIYIHIYIYTGFRVIFQILFGFSTNVHSIVSCLKKILTKAASLPHFPEIFTHQFSLEFSQSLW